MQTVECENYAPYHKLVNKATKFKRLSDDFSTYPDFSLNKSFPLPLAILEDMDFRF